MIWKHFEISTHFPMIGTLSYIIASFYEMPIIESLDFNWSLCLSVGLSVEREPAPIGSKLPQKSVALYEQSVLWQQNRGVQFR